MLYDVSIVRSAGLAVAFLGLVLVGGCNTASFSDGVGATGATSRQSLTRPAAPIGGESADLGGSETALAADPDNPSQVEAALRRGTDAAALAEVPPVAFLPVTGAPQSKVTTLAGSIRRAAQQQAVPVVVSIDQGARYQIKGYFSALPDSGGTLLVYVWDVLDRNGTRIHRISGEERAGASSGDPWTSVSDDVIERVAQETMSSLRSWIQSGSAG